MGEGKGWISIYRSIQEHWLWQEKPYDKAHAWIDLLLSANHQEAKILIDNTLISLEKGSFFTSELKLANKWGWSKKKVRNFLELLANDNMILKESTKKGTKLSIVNYRAYQTLGNHDGTTEEPQENHQGTIKEPLRNTNNNDNNDNNNNNKNIYCPNSNEFRLASYLFNFIKRNNPDAKEPNLQKWSKQFDYILRIDKRDIEEVKSVIKWCQNDTFWLKNILSSEKLRKQYDRLLVEMKTPKTESNNSPPKGNFNNYDQRKYDFDDLEKKLLGWDNVKEGE